MNVQLVSPPSEAPITVAVARSHVRLAAGIDDGALGGVPRKDRKRERKRLMGVRALTEIDRWLGATPLAAE